MSGGLGELLQVCPEALSHADRVALLGRLEAVRAGLDAVQARTLAALADSDVSEQQWVREEVACALHLAPVTAAGRLADATDLVHRLPATLDALSQARIGWGHARVLIEATRPLSDAVCAAVQQRVLPRAGGRTVAQVRQSVRRAVAALDTRRTEDRHRDALLDRRVVLTPQDHGMAELWALLPADTATALMAVLNSHADTLKTIDTALPRDQRRTADQRRADALGQLAPAVDRLGTRRAGPARRPWVYAALTAAAVAVIALGGAAVVRHERAADPAVTAPPPGTKPVSYRGITIFVPSRMQVSDFGCGAVRANTVRAIDPTVGLKCAPLLNQSNDAPTGTAVLLAPADYRYEPGHPRGVTVSITTRGALAVRVTVTARTRSEAQVVIRSVHATPVDAQGCRAYVLAVVPGQRATSSIVPDSPVSATVCDYVEDDSSRSDYSGWLLGSFRLTTQETERAARTLRDLPIVAGGLIHIVPTLPRWIVFRYADGSTRTVVVQRHFYPSQVTDGQIFARDEDGALAELRPG